MPDTHTLADAETFLRRRLAQPLPGPAAQLRFAPVPRRAEWAPHLLPDTARHAAALILLYPGAGDDGQQPMVPLTERHLSLPHHPGQISLPGGAIDPGESPEAAALREAEEEIGVLASGVRLLGALSTLWVDVSSFVVHPFVGIVSVASEFQPHPDEVSEMVPVPLTQVLDPYRLAWSGFDRAGVQIRYPYFDLAGRHVWGATAMILGEFACLFRPDHQPRPDAG